jgi:hypothetical protein
MARYDDRGYVDNEDNASDLSPTGAILVVILRAHVILGHMPLVELSGKVYL